MFRRQKFITTEKRTEKEIKENKIMAKPVNMSYLIPNVPYNGYK